MSLKRFAGMYDNAPASTAGYITGRVAQSVLASAGYIGLTQLIGEPDFMVLFAGFIPLPFGVKTGIPLFDGVSVEYYEVANSQDLLQYRAIGAAFMAQQEGAHTGVRIDLKLYGEYKELWLSILQMLYVWGRTEIKTNDDLGIYKSNETGTVNVVKSGTQNFAVKSKSGYALSVRSKAFAFSRLFNATLPFTNTPGQTPIKLGKVGGNVLYKTELSASLPDEPVDYIPDAARVRDEVAMSSNKYITTSDDDSWTQDEYHKTFTMISRTDILFDMYIETLGYRRIVDEGKDVIHVNLLIRRFTPPDIIKHTYKQAIEKNKPGTTVGTGEFKIIRVIDKVSVGDKLLSIKGKSVGINTINLVLSSAWRAINSSRIAGFRFSSNVETMKKRRMSGIRLIELIADSNAEKKRSCGNY